MLLIKAIFLISSAAWVACTVTGLNYIDHLNFKPLKSPPSEDVCNPLYWYPRNIPEYCYFKTTPESAQKPMPVPLPIPIPLPPQPFPIPMPMGPMHMGPMPMSPMPMGPMPSMFPVQLPYSMSQGYPMPAPHMPMSPLPMSIYAQPMPLPFGIPLAPTNPMLPVAGVPAMPYPNIFPQYRPRYQAGMVPGIPSMVTHDGGINILPFSDAYADLLEKHKQKMIRKKIKRVLDNYDDYSGRRETRRRRHRH